MKIEIVHSFPFVGKRIIDLKKTELMRENNFSSSCLKVKKKSIFTWFD